MDQLSNSAIGAVAELAREKSLAVTTISAPSGAKGIPTSIPVLLDPKSGEATGIKSLFDDWRVTPEHKKGVARVTTLESFIDLTERHKTEHSVIFADTNWKQPRFVSIIDYHQMNIENEVDGGGSFTTLGAPDNGRHRIEYAFPLSEEWQAWVGCNKKAMNQVEFAEFIEDRIGELAAPHEDEITYWEGKLGGKMGYPNELQLLSRGLKIHAQTRVSNIVTLSSGEGEISFEEEHRDMKGDKLIIPSLFIIQLPPFFQGEATRVPVRLRYRAKEGITWFYQLYRPDQYITEQVMRDLARAESATGLPAYQGAPEMSA
ncbi:DUF2303 family protein [Neorhizobium petrolearium]|uniref:DUF2303 family protein n=1 Tax=Neorhizobium petrolearium TaxID=515361 RepID=A0ABY8M2E9_9HYPH|nr:DUF2303 family protein [Neorhizobium petrolearium]MCC2608360.1 YfdQ family protein [Neorhizobium petrolearium]WGI68639.1 DUF2303 family protein [Neorhizobium petrolearium]